MARATATRIRSFHSPTPIERAAMFKLGLWLLVSGLLLSVWWPMPGFFLLLASLAVWVTAVGRFGFDRWRGLPLPRLPVAPEPLFTKAQKRPPVSDPFADQLVSLDDPDLPASIRAAAAARMAPGFTLWRCPRSARGKPVVEWWLFDAEGELVEALWER